MFWIYCEGQTEPLYFKSFPVNPATTEVIAEGYGRSRTSLVDHVIRLLENGQYLKGQKNYDSQRELWVVFDYDWVKTKKRCEDLKETLEKAKSKRINIAFSNDAFELWIVLHFQYLDSRCHRTDLYRILSKRFAIKFETIGKQEQFVKTLYAELLPYQAAAVANAKTLYKNNSHLDPCSNNPFTGIYELVEQLNRNLRL